MKTKKVIGLVLVVCLVSAFVIAAEVSDEKEAVQKPSRVDVAASRASRQRPESAARVSPTSPARQSSLRNRQQAYQERLAGQMASHKQAVAELEAIKKIAEEEGATRTTEALQKMIDKKNADFKQSMERFESQRSERLKQLQQRMVETPSRTKPAAATESKATEEK